MDTTSQIWFDAGEKYLPHAEQTGEFMFTLTTCAPSALALVAVLPAMGENR
jgi:hypothetical protein